MSEDGIRERRLNSLGAIPGANRLLEKIRPTTSLWMRLEDGVKGLHVPILYRLTVVSGVLAPFVDAGLESFVCLSLFASKDQ